MLLLEISYEEDETDEENDSQEVKEHAPEILNYAIAVITHLLQIKVVLVLVVDEAEEGLLDGVGGDHIEVGHVVDEGVEEDGV